MNATEAIEYIHSVCWKGSVPGLGRTQALLEKMGMAHIQAVLSDDIDEPVSAATLMVSPGMEYTLDQQQKLICNCRNAYCSPSHLYQCS